MAAEYVVPCRAVPLFRRATSDPTLAAFRAVVTHVDAAQRALISAVPTSRDPGVPIDGAVDESLRHLRTARSAMDGWKSDGTAHEWTKCMEAIDRTESAARALPDAGPLGFEALNARIGEVLAPLEAFADASIVLRRR